MTLKKKIRIERHFYIIFKTFSILLVHCAAYINLYHDSVKAFSAFTCAPLCVSQIQVEDQVLRPGCLA